MKARLRPLLLSVLACVCLTQARAAEPQAVPEYTMKAAYLYNFALLATWPGPAADASSAFNLCVSGQEEVLAALESMRGRLIGSHPLNPMRISQASAAKQCHLLYVGEGDGLRGGQLLETVRGEPVLTVTDEPLVARSGAMLSMFTDGKRLAFDVDLASASRAQIKFSSKLLRLANRVSGE
jgi:hypothetical protein